MLFESEYSRKSVCRVCLDKLLSNAMSFDHAAGRGLLQLYEFCFGITVSPEEVPRKICGICIKKMEEFAKFKNQAHKSEKLLKTKLDFSEITGSTINISNNVVKHELPEDINFVNLPNYEYANDIKKLEKQENENINYDSISDYEGVNSIPQENYKSVDKDDLKLVSTKVEEKFDMNYIKIGNGFSFDTNVKRKHIKTVKRKTRMLKLLDNAPTYFCGLCDTTSHDAIQEKQHLTEHSSNNDLSCRLCEFVGRDFADMVTHRYDHHSKEYKIHLHCHLCSKKYLAKLALQFHYRSNHLKKKGGICAHCGKQFGTYTTWRDHEKLHTTEKFKCDLCGRKFLFRHDLKTHMINHSEVKGYVCDMCGKGFKRNSNLKRHLQTTHDSNKVTCNHCNGVFKNQKSLKSHLQRVTKEKNYQCKVCLKYFDTPNMLMRHMVWHGDERPFICNVCGLSYKSTSQLNIHMRKHTGVMPFKCSQCPKSYPTSNQLREHMSNHSGERRYKCSHCPKSFHHKKLMVKHISKRHEVKDTFEMGKHEEKTDA